MHTFINSTVYKTASFLLAVTLALLALTHSAGASVTPELVIESVEIGNTIDVQKEVTTPTIPQDPEICFLADTTGSMVSALANVQANAGPIMDAVIAVQPNAAFCAAQYRDIGDTPLFNVDQDLTTDTTAVQAAIDTWVAGGGGDTPEAQLNALHELATGAADYDGPNRIIVWFGDASGHDPSNSNTLASTIIDLQDAGISVIAIPVANGFGDGLDATGQATALTDQTGGILLPDASSEEVAAAILEGLTALTTDVWYDISCDTGLSVALTPEVHYAVTGGDTVNFSETITVDNDETLQGQTLHCAVDFLANSYPEGGSSIGTERISIYVPDTLSPIAQCTSSVNPHGNKKPAAGSADLPGAKGGQNEDGFYEVTAEDNVGIAGIYVNGFGPYLSGDTVKITQAPGATPSEKKMGSTQDGNNGASNAVVAHLILTDDPVVTAVDGSGNEDAAACFVPPPPK